MDEHKNLQLKEKESIPNDEIIKSLLKGSYSAYETLQDKLPELDMEQDWMWYTPYKAWFAKGIHWWTTIRGTRKEKVLYWLYIYNGYFSVAIWFKEKNRKELLEANVSKETKKLIMNAETKMKMPTFPVLIDVKSIKELKDIYTLIECKKSLECN